jgi:hypothetical protein
MPLLFAADGAKFSGVIESINVQFRASYKVILHVGGEQQVESDLRMFETEVDAVAWLRKESELRGFERIGFARR